jgi:Uma2 family endonuclease
MPAAPERKLTVAEYLAFERTAEQKHEFLDGELFVKARASREHNVVKENLIGELFVRLKGGPCRTFSSDQRVKVARTGLYTYPDLMIVCGPPEYDPDDRDTFVNPQVVIEILSPSTEAYDRGAKFRHYQKLPPVREYVLVSQDQMQVELFVRQPDEKWMLTTFDGAEGEFTLATVPVRLPLADVYRGVEIPDRPPR